LGRYHAATALLIKEANAGVSVNQHVSPLSLTYRLRASAVGKQAYEIEDAEEMLRQLHLALSWIQLAENEEALTAARNAVAPLNEH
jgi:hypothetical protein